MNLNWELTLAGRCPKAAKTICTEVRQASFLSLEKLWWSPRASEPLPLDPRNTRRWTPSSSCAEAWVTAPSAPSRAVWVGASLPRPQGGRPRDGEETVGVCVSHLGPSFHNLQRSRQPLHLAKCMRLNENLAGFSELALPLSAGLIGPG